LCLLCLVVAVESEKAKLQDEIRSLQSTIQALRDDVKVHVKLAEDERSRYQSELISHAADAQKAEAAHRDLSAATQRLASLELELRTATETHAQALGSWNAQRDSWQAQVTALEEKAKELAHQNSLLLSQLEAVTIKARQVQEQALFGGGSSGAVMTGLTAFTAQTILPASAQGL
jgi:hypothetical protein